MVQTTLIILTRNEIEGVTAVLPTIPRNFVDEVFAVDFNSTDGTVEFFKQNNINVVNQQKPGRSEAFRIGAAHARGKYLIFFSPDGNEDPSDIPTIIRLLKKGNDLVIASRFMKESRNEEDDQAFRFRKWANQVFTRLVNLLWRGHVTDSINGYRGIKKTSFESLQIDAEGFAVEFQMTIRALKTHMKIAEFPTREGNRIGGSSGSAAIPTGMKFLYYLCRELMIGTNFDRKDR